LLYYRNNKLQQLVNKTVKSENIDTAVIFSSAMATYVQKLATIRKLIDFVDVDSAKWTQYADNHRWPLSWLYRREGIKLLNFEREMAVQAENSFFVTENETNLFRRMAPECSKITAMCNGVDADFFSPEQVSGSPYQQGELAVVFTGAMDYWPNIDAVSWFDSEILPQLIVKWPNIRFYIVGRSPSAEVQRLAKAESTVVTGTVEDVRPYLRYAKVVVAPLRLARGIQNKVLEAMAIGRPVVTSRECSAAIDAVVGRDLLAASTVEEYVESVDRLLRMPDYSENIGFCARKQVIARYSWDAHLSIIDRHIEK
jgi:sugar transferase (PEP-CTERM/EpsH1 system associated)